MSASLFRGVFKIEEKSLKNGASVDKPGSAPTSPVSLPSTASPKGGETTSAIGSQADDDEAYVTFLIRIRLIEGHNLAIKDASGSSDPYVKFKYKNRTCFKSTTMPKNLNPVWNEEFSLIIDDPITPIIAEVFDYDRWASDDSMGTAQIDLSHLRLFQETATTLKLCQPDSTESGELAIVAMISPLTAIEKNEFHKKSVRGVICERPKREPAKVTQVWSSVVNIVLVEGRNLCLPDATKGCPDPFVKFKLDSEKYKSKPVPRSPNPKWLEQFDLHLYDETKQTLELTVIDKKTTVCIGKCSIELSNLEKETATKLLCELDRGTGSILLLVSITGIVSTDAVVNPADFTSDDIRNAIVAKYSLLQTAQCFNDIGFLTIKVFQARNLSSTDFMSKCNPFVVVELVNALLQTHTEYKTVNPEWNKLFTFAVKDIHSLLDITVYDEDPSKKAEFIGKVSIPLLNIENGEKRWYTLKNRKLDAPTNGQILLEMDIIWNPVRAAIRTFNPREQKYMQIEPKFKRRLFLNNYSRLKEFAVSMMQVSDYVQSCFDWDIPLRSIITFILFVVIVYFFQLCHIPILIMLFFLQPYKTKYIARGSSIRKSINQVKSQSGSEDDDELIEQNTGTSIRERLNTVQDTLAKVQVTMDYMASLLERIRNTFNFTRPYLSMLAVVVLSVVTVLLYFVPLRWIILVWGVNKFTKKLRNPNFIPNNELLDFLSCVPSDSEVKAYKEFPVPAISETQK